ncbi:MAG: hypothetical protein BMS9Abin05_1827 [Rhodothermia bacterium]|nr:MAG: hypothetical protein BMS9Abin05_1827 [Rhodothermia bacterium]
MFDWFNLAGAGTALAYLIEVTGKSLVVFIMAGLLIALFRRSSAADRHRIWFAALAGVILFPILTAVLPTWGVIQNPEWLETLKNANTELAEPTARVGMPSAPPMPSASELPPALGFGAVPPAVETSPDDSLPAKPLEEASTGVVGSSESSHPMFESLSALVSRLRNMHWTTALFWIWLMGAVAVLSQLLIGAFGILFLARRAIPVRDQGWTDLVNEIGDRLFLTRDVHLLKSRDTSMPMTWGGINPVVLLPADAEAWSDERRMCVLTHELAHVKRWDCATQGIAQLACAIYWFNPIVWFAAKRLRIEREKACDDYVISGGTRASNYADHLLEIARSLKASFLPPLGAVSMARPSQLEGRVLAILDPSPRKHRFSTSARVLVTVLMLGIIFPLAALTPASDSTLESDVFRVTTIKVPSNDPKPSSLSRIRSKSVVSAPDYFVSVADTTEMEKRRLRLVKAFKTALSDTDPEIRRNAAHMLGKMGEEESIDALADALRSDEDEDVREQSAWGLGEIGTDQAVRTLIAALHDSDVRVRRQSIWALGEIESYDSINALLDQLRVEADADARKLVVWALGEIEDDRAVDGLSNAYVTETDRGVREKIIWALGEIESQRAAATLRRAVEDEDPEIRTMALWALTELEDLESIPAFRRALKDSEPDVRLRAVRGLAELEDPEAVEGLIEAANDSDPEVRQMAVWGLGELENARAFETLRGALEDQDLAVRRSAVRALGEMQDDRAIEGLTQALSSNDDETRQLAAWALGEIESERSVAALMSALNDSSRDVRKTALWALAEIGDARSIGAMIEATNDPDEEVRETALRFLLEYERDEIEMAFIRSLKDDSESVREVAALGLGDYESEKTIRALEAVILHDTSVDVKAHAAYALGEIGTEKAISVLEKALEDESPEVRKAVTSALSRVDFSDSRHRQDPPGYDIDIDGFAEAMVGVGEGITDVAVATVSMIAERIVSPELDAIVTDATERSLGSIDWDEIEEAVEKALEDFDEELDDSITDVLIEIVRANPDSRVSRKALKALNNSDHPDARAFIERFKN